MSKALRTNAFFECLRSIEKQRIIDQSRNIGCAQGRSCLRRDMLHISLWHRTLILTPHPLLERIGGISELVSNVFSHLDNDTLFKAAQICHKWNKEAVRLLWHTLVDEGKLLAASLNDDRVDIYTAVVRHLTFSTLTNRNTWGYSYPTSATRLVPVLSGLTSLNCEGSSLSKRSAEELTHIFLPSLKQLVIADGVAYEHNNPDEAQSPGVSWFSIMATNCKRLRSITIGAKSHIKSAEFDRFLENSLYLESVTLGTGHEHLLSDGLVPILKSIEVNINDWDTRTNSRVYEQLPKMLALEYLKITITNRCFTGKDLLRLKILSHLKSFQIDSSSGVYGLRCTAAVEEVAEFVGAIPKLDSFAIHIPCKFVEDVAQLHGEDWFSDQSRTFFPANACRQQYLDYLNSLTQDKLDVFLATFELLPFSEHES